MDALEIANFLAKELWCHQLASLDGLNSGVPTRTTATITPTQLRNFEQTYIELTSCRADQNNHAGFVPPALTNSGNYGLPMLSQTGYCDSGPATSLHVSPGPFSTSGDSSSPDLPTPKRRMGGRRPTKAPQDISPEEEERRKVRRERNKMAAARCRKRRLDHTNELQDETDKLEDKRRNLQDEIKHLNRERQKLTEILNSHLPACRAPIVDKRSVSPPDIKPYEAYTYPEMRIKEEVDSEETIILDNDIFTTPMTDNRVMLSAANMMSVVTSHPVTSIPSLETPPVILRPNRPSFLQVPPISQNPAQMHNNKISGNNKIAGVEISTPSNGIPFNFDSLMEGGTGLTPVHPHPNLICGIQQRSAPDVTPPDSHNSLVSL